MIDLSRYAPAFKETGLCVYTPNFEQDALLLKLWLHLVESEDLNRLLPPESRPLSRFFKLFQEGVTTFYCLDDQGIWLLAWFTPISSRAKSTFFSFWARSDKRNTKIWLKMVNLIYMISFDFWDSLFGITNQPKLLALHKKAGYSIVGVAQGLLDFDKQSFIVQLTKANYMNSKFYQLFRKKGL
jgi:hypothetical protein